MRGKKQEPHTCRQDERSCGTWPCTMYHGVLPLTITGPRCVTGYYDINNYGAHPFYMGVDESAPPPPSPQGDPIPYSSQSIGVQTTRHVATHVGTRNVRFAVRDIERSTPTCASRATEPIDWREPGSVRWKGLETPSKKTRCGKGTGE